MPIFIVSQDITKMKVDAIVNAANNSLLGGGGVDGAIHRAAGPKLLEECIKLKGCKTGEAKYTLGYNLDAKYVIHTVGPIYQGGNNGEATLLASCYKNSLNIAKELSLESIAFPAISTGVYGYPKDEAFEISYNVIKEFLNDYDLDVYIVIYGNQKIEHHSRIDYLASDYLEKVREKEKIRYTVFQEEQFDDFKFSKKSKKDSSNETLMTCSISNFNDEPKLDISFQQFLFFLIDKKGISDVEAYKRSNINRRLFSKIKSDIHYQPSKNTVFAFAIGLKLNLKETKELLHHAGFSLSKSIMQDALIEKCIENEIYDIDEINIVLFNYDQPLLGQSTK